MTTEKVCRRPGCPCAVTNAQEFCGRTCRWLAREQRKTKALAMLIDLPVDELFPSLAAAAALADTYAAEWQRVTEAATEFGVDLGGSPRRRRAAPV